ncbi:D-malate degradation protein R [Pantoea agglomerans]|uniref:D-malate degradation protein R n=1 Tax=Enterobacter agglomerans TaxID=549 RepID=A0A379LTJ6_ENTAG|nr:D-malate degradation protein R [Pantoea agglomerans]
MNADKNALEVFVIVAQTRNFRLAAEQLGVTRPAISQSLRRLEDRLNLTLMQRTTRSVQLTEAGQRLYAEVAPAINQLNRAVTDIAELAAEPRGQLRLAISSIAERMLGGKLLASFITAYPQVELYITVTDEEFDIVGQGYDAGVRLGEVIAQDMIAVPVSTAQRQVAVASPRLSGSRRHAATSSGSGQSSLHRLAKRAWSGPLSLGVCRAGTRV